MRLEPGEVPAMPLPAALVDRDGATVAATPEWPGRCPGTLSYRTGAGHLLVAPDTPAPELDALMARLHDEIGAAASALTGDAALQTTVLAAGLALVAGRPAGEDRAGSVEEVVALTTAAVRARTQDLPVEVVPPLLATPVPAPAAVALALVQFAVNAYQHDAAARVHLRVGPGPTFTVEWPGTAEPAPAVRTHRHALRRERWGWGYVQLAADALGAVAMPPGPTGPGLIGAALSLGSPRLGLPLACVRDGRVERASQAWEEDPTMPPRGESADMLHDLVAAARARPGQIAYRALHRARLRGDRTWVALAPETGSSRVRDLVAGLHHERALWSAPEPHATRVAALTTLLRVAMGEPWPSVPPSVWAEVLPEACAALGVAPPGGEAPLCPPDPRVAAFLLAETGGRLTCERDEVVVVPAHLDSALRAVWPRPGERLRINP